MPHVERFRPVFITYLYRSFGSWISSRPEEASKKNVHEGFLFPYAIISNLKPKR
jgi:hypothetical protein